MVDNESLSWRVGTMTLPASHLALGRDEDGVEALLCSLIDKQQNDSTGLAQQRGGPLIQMTMASIRMVHRAAG